MPNTVEQLAIFKEFLRDKLLNREHPLFDHAIKWVKTFPGGLSEKDKAELRGIICHTFDVTQEELVSILAGDINIDHGDTQDPKEVEAELWRLIPKGGFFERY